MSLEYEISLTEAWFLHYANCEKAAIVGETIFSLKGKAQPTTISGANESVSSALLAVLEECEWERVGRQKAKVRGLEMEDDEGRRGSQEGLILISIPTTELAPYFFNCQKNPSLRDRIAAKRR